MFNYKFLVSALMFVIIDSVYLNIMKNYFENQIKIIQNEPMKLKIIGILICYIFLILGLNYFIIKPNKSVSDAFLLGLVIYGVYETTNYAIFTNWSILTLLIDTLWGGILFGSTTYFTKLILGL